MGRRLPVYLLLDVSGSMMGEPITAVQNGVQTLVSALNGDPQALESAYLSVITFSNSAQQVVPLTELNQFVPPQLQASDEVMSDGSKVLKKPGEYVVLNEGTRILLSTEEGGRLVFVQLAGK